MQQAKKKKAPKKKTADAAAEDPALQQARTTLMAEIAKEQREMTTIASAIATLEAAPSPAKLKRAITGDWQLVFASDEAAVAPFAVGASSGPFVVLEDIFHRIQTAGDAVQSIEVVRKIGPFGNSCSSIHGRWSVDDEGVVSWKTQYMLDERGREVKPPNGGEPRKAKASHVSSELLVMRREGASDSYAVFSKLGKGELKKELDAYSVDAELYIA